MLSFVFISTSAMVADQATGRQQSVIRKLPRSFVPIPLAKKSSSYPVLSANSVLAIDMNTGVPLYEKNPDSQLFPASTTKIVTALVALDTYPLDSVIKVGKVNIVGQKMGLTYGEEMRVEDLLYGLLVFSANDAAEVLADNYPDGRDSFINAMNDKARMFSLDNTKFYNPSGIDGLGHVTTARDLIRVSTIAMKNPEFAKIVSTKEIIVKDIGGKKVHKLANINELLGKVPGVLGVKTGWTESARENLVTYLDRDNHKIMIAMLGSQDRFGETEELIDWIFTSYEWQEVKVAYSP